jgi:hypothetical protein
MRINKSHILRNDAPVPYIHPKRELPQAAAENLERGRGKAP